MRKNISRLVLLISFRIKCGKHRIKEIECEILDEWNQYWWIKCGYKSIVVVSKCGYYICAYTIFKRTWFEKSCSFFSNGKTNKPNILLIKYLQTPIIWLAFVLYFVSFQSLKCLLLVLVSVLWLLFMRIYLSCAKTKLKNKQTLTIFALIYVVTEIVYIYIFFRMKEERGQRIKYERIWVHIEMEC